MHRTFVFALGLALAGAGTASAQVEEVVVPPATVYESYSPVVPVVPYYTYRVPAPLYGPVYEYAPGPYYVPGPTVIRQRTFFGPRRVRTVYRYW